MKHYEIFLKTVETGNITRTAEIMNYTQSGVSHAISAIEKETSFPVFNRSKNGVSLTENGKKILPDVQALVNQYNKLNQTINDINGRIEGTIRIAAFPSIITEIMPGIIKEFSTKYPAVEFELVDGTYDEICQMVDEGRVDIGFLPSVYADKYNSAPIYEDQMLAIMPLEHKLIKKNKVSVDDLLKYPIVSQFKGCEQLLTDALDGNEVRPEFEFTDDRVALLMINQGFGVGIITDSMLKNFNIPVAVRPLSPDKKRIICLVTLEPESKQTGLIRELISFIKSYANRIS